MCFNSMTKEQETLINAVGRAEVWTHDAIKQIDAGAMRNDKRRAEWRRLLFLAVETLAEIKSEIQDEIDKKE